MTLIITAVWRRRRDSNPRWSYKPHTPLAGERLQPLGHLSRFFYLLPSNYYRDFPRLPDLADFAQL